MSVAACASGSSNPESGASSTTVVATTTPARTSALPPAPGISDRGALVSQESFSGGGDLVKYRGRRVVYRSTAGYRPGAATGEFGTQVSGVVLIPNGLPPTGGWPIVAYGHGTTGTTPNCGPSGYPDLLGDAGTVASLLSAGWAVAVPDYQGLGTLVSDAQPHPYLEPRTAAFNMIDAVRAARRVFGDIGDTWAAMGSSQGGQAAWAAAEYAGDYGSGLHFVGSTASAPAADLSPVVRGDATVYTTTQKMFIPMIFDGLKAQYPQLNEADYFRGAIAADHQALTSCGPDYLESRLGAALEFQPGDAAMTTAAADKLRPMLQARALPQRPAAGPMYLAYGDQDQIINSEWTTAAIGRACRLGDVIDSEIVHGKGHTNVGRSGQEIDWLKDRFAGRPAPNTCASGVR